MSDETHIVPLKVYIGTFVGLLLLTGLTTGIAYIDMGEMNTVVALIIAVVKMLLVALFFMHLWYSKGLIRVVFVASFLWLAIMVTFTLSDVFTRNWTPTNGTWGPSISLSGPR